MVKMNKETEYEKDLNELKEQILNEGDTLLTKRDLLERFCEIDKEYNGQPWNLLQILANINILIGEKPCEDATAQPEIIRCRDCKHWTNNIGDPVLRDNYCNEKTHGFYYRCRGGLLQFCGKDK